MLVASVIYANVISFFVTRKCQKNQNKTTTKKERWK